MQSVCESDKRTVQIGLYKRVDPPSGQAAAPAPNSARPQCASSNHSMKLAAAALVLSAVVASALAAPTDIEDQSDRAGMPGMPDMSSMTGGMSGGMPDFSSWWAPYLEPTVSSWANAMGSMAGHLWGSK